MSAKTDCSYFSAYHRFDPIACDCGSLTRPQYRDKVELNGSITVEELDKPFDLDGLIQSCRDECLVYNILERAVSDPQILSKFSGSFVDVRSDQISFAEHLQRVIDLQNNFDTLPVSVRKMFDNNLHVFVEALRDGSADKVIEGYIKQHSDQFIKQPESVPDPEGGQTV